MVASLVPPFRLEIYTHVLLEMEICSPWLQLLARVTNIKHSSYLYLTAWMEFCLIAFMMKNIFSGKGKKVWLHLFSLREKNPYIFLFQFEIKNFSPLHRYEQNLAKTGQVMTSVSAMRYQPVNTFLHVHSK